MAKVFLRVKNGIDANNPAAIHQKRSYRTCYNGSLNDFDGKILLSRAMFFDKLIAINLTNFNMTGVQIMKYVCRALITALIMLCLVSLASSSEPNDPNTTAKVTAPKGTGPRLTFEKTTHDFGNIPPLSSHSYEFQFSNTGDGMLEIGTTQTTCGCTVPELKKKQYQPGESGALKVTFTSSSVISPASKQIFVSSNDAYNPKITLTIKANVIRKVEYQPQNLALSLRKENGGCPDITLKSIDGQAFAITDINSIPRGITAKVDPAKTATEFVIKPIVDVEKIKQALRGEVRISLTHPDCKVITMIYNAPPLIKAEPAMVLFFNLEPKKADKRDKIWIMSNYDEDFEIVSAAAPKGYFKATNITKQGKGRYEMTIEVMPPEITNTALKIFMDTLVVKTKEAGQVEIICRGFYSKQLQQSADPNKK